MTTKYRCEPTCSEFSRHKHKKLANNAVSCYTPARKPDN